MKKLLSYLIIIFFGSLTFSFSEDISDFQIEGISVDGSVLDYFTSTTLARTSKVKMKIKSSSIEAKEAPSGSGSYTDSYGESEASETIETIKVTSIPQNNLETYDDVKVTYFSETNIIKNVTGIKYFEKNSCDGKQKEAFNDLNKILAGNYKLDKKKRIVTEDIKLVQYAFNLENGGSIKIECYDQKKDKEKEKSVLKEKFDLFIKYEKNIDVRPGETFKDYLKRKENNDGEWVSALVLTINSKGIKKTVKKTLSTGQKINTKFIQLKPVQADIGKRRKF